MPPSSKGVPVLYTYMVEAFTAAALIVSVTGVTSEGSVSESLARLLAFLGLIAIILYWAYTALALHASFQRGLGLVGVSLVLSALTLSWLLVGVSRGFFKSPYGVEPVRFYTFASMAFLTMLTTVSLQHGSSNG